MKGIYVLFLIAASRSRFVLSIPDVKIDTTDLQDKGVPWKAEGCYNEAVGRRALAQAKFYDYSNMTVEACQSFCANMGYLYAGLEYMGECYCGLVNNSLGVSNTSECYQTCAGNSSQICGGPNRLSLYSRAIPRPIINPGENLFEFLGCYADTQGARLLSHFATIPGGSANVSILECTKTCFSTGFMLAGLEYAGECWCDNEYQIELDAIDISKCDMPCKGNFSELCGGSDAINLYKYNPLLLGEPGSILSSPVVIVPTPTVSMDPLAPILSLVTSAIGAIQTIATSLELVISAYPSIVAAPITTIGSELISYFEEPTLIFDTVANPAYKDTSNLLGSTITFLGNMFGLDDVSVFNMSSQRTSDPNDRSYCLSKSIDLVLAGSYHFDVGVGRQVLKRAGKPFPSNDRLQFELYYDKTLISGLQNVCNPSYGECSQSSPFGGYDIIENILRVPYRDIGRHTLAMCGVFRGDAVNGLDSILIHFLNFAGPILGG